jgi:hypothetical protein
LVVRGTFSCFPKGEFLKWFPEERCQDFAEGTTMRPGLILAPRDNRPGTKDATGAFHLGAKWFKEVHRTPYAIFDNYSVEDAEHNPAGQQKIQKGVFAVMEKAAGPWEVFAYFGHGVPTGLPSAGICEGSLPKFAKLIDSKAAPGIVVLLYACATGQPGAFAAKLQVALKGKKARVYGHTTYGHALGNPKKTVHPAGQFVVARSDPLWGNWVRTLKASLSNEKIDLWARYPFMMKQELAAELSGTTNLLGRWAVSNPASAGQAAEQTVFFADGIVAKTAGNVKYRVASRGTWKVGHDKLEVKWDGSALEEWPLPLDLRGQNVRVRTGNQVLHCKATKLEDANVNQRVFFHLSTGEMW